MRAIVALALVVAAAPALAAETSFASEPLTWLSAAVAAWLTGVVTVALRRLFGVSLEARHREALQSAIRTGVGLALAAMAELLARGQSPEQAQQAGTDAALAYVRRSVPDAIKALGPDELLLRDMLRSQLHLAQAA